MSVFFSVIHHRSNEKTLCKHVVKDIISVSIKFIIQVCAGFPQKDDDDDGRCYMLVYCTLFIWLATKYNESIREFHQSR